MTPNQPVRCTTAAAKAKTTQYSEYDLCGQCLMRLPNITSHQLGCNLNSATYAVSPTTVCRHNKIQKAGPEYS